MDLMLGSPHRLCHYFAENLRSMPHNRCSMSMNAVSRTFHRYMFFAKLVNDLVFEVWCTHIGNFPPS